MRCIKGELFWELAEHQIVPDGFQGVAREAVEVLAFRPPGSLQVRAGGIVYNVELSWQKLVPPVVQKAGEGST